GNVAPQQDDSLVFPAGVSKLSAQDDYAAGTRFRSITISDGYNLSGGNSLTLLEGVTFNSSSSSAQVSVPLTLGASASIFSANVGTQLNITGTLDLGNQQALTTDGRGDINVSGIIKGT